MKNIITITLLLFVLSAKSQDLTKVYEKVNPAVVIILTEEKKVVQTESITKKVNSAGLGSGFMISDTQIITAAHVVQVAEKLNVKFIDGEIIPAKVISSFNTADVALIELIWPKKNATIVKLGDSDQVKIGAEVFIVGAPYGLSHSLSSGHISGVIKDTKSKNPFMRSEFIQTDAAINTGNSGGPMFNSKGEVIGIVSNILTQSGGFQGIGFVTSSNLAKDLLFENKKFWSGVEMQPISGKIANILNVPQESALLIQKVVKFSPLGILGLKGGDTPITINNQTLLLGGDIILAFNGIKIEDNEASFLKIANTIENNKSDKLAIELKVLRNGEVITLGRK